MNDADRTMLRKSAREEQLAALRDGRKNRAVTIPSGKAYKRRTKHKEF